MTDKEQIMIDGVNVNRCIDFNKRDKVSCYHILYDKCNESPNCYFKQLARKTQIVEQQQKTLDELIGCVSIWEGFTEEESKLAKDSSIADLIMLLREKRRECEELKGKLRKLELKNTTLQNRNQQLDGATLEAIRYRKALEEIKEVCIKDTREFADGTQIRYDSLDEILDIINKAKGEGNAV